MRAANEAQGRGAEVLVVCKSPAGYNNATVVTGGGFRASMGGLPPDEHMGTSSVWGIVSTTGGSVLANHPLQ